MKILICYLAAISVISVAVTVHDKRSARRGSWRVPENTLLFLAFIGGAAAMWLTMIVIRHKTRRTRFMLGIPMMILLHLAAAAAILFYVRNK